MFDSVLLELMKTDKNKGLLHLIDQYTPLVYTIVKSKISSVCTEEDIEETVSNVFNVFYNQAGGHGYVLARYRRRKTKRQYGYVF